MDTPFDIPGYGLALLLRQRRHNCRNHLAGHLAGVNALFFEQNADAQFFQFPDGRKTVFRIAGKAGNGLDQNAVDFSFAAILHHALKIFALFDRRAGDALIGVNINHFPIRIAGDEFRIILVLDAIGVELIFAGGADAGVGCDAQLPRDNFVVRRDYNDTLLFQRKISVGLLLCHAVHPLCSNTHYHTKGVIAMTRTEKNQA